MTTVTALSVTGMTCSHCVSAVTHELEEVAGVQDVSVELHAGETSSVRVISDRPVDESALRAAIDEAGYDVVGVDVVENAVAAESAAQAPARQATHTLPMTDVRREAGGRAAPASHGMTSEQHHHEAYAGEAHGGCGCGCGGQGRQGLGIGLPIVPLG